MSPEEYESKKTDISETNPSNAEGANVSELDKFFDNDSIKANQETIEGVLNKEENKSLKEGFENFLLNEKNTIKKNAIKLKLSKATDELTVKSIIAEVVEGGYKVGDKKNVGEDTGKGENVKEGESIGGEKPAENQNGNLEDALQQTVQNEEEAVQNEEEAVQNEEEAVQNEEEAVQNEEQAEQAKIVRDQKDKQAGKNTNETNILKEEVSGLEELNIAIEARDRLIYKYKNLNSVTNNNTDNYKAVKQQLENNGVLNQLRQTNHDEQFINNYILVQTTLTELKSNPTNYEQSDISNFDKIVKNLNNACNIPDTSLSNFDSKNISQTRTELFNSEVGNDSLISAKKSNMESHDYSEIFPEKIEDDELIAKYGNFLEGNLKTFWQNYKNNPNEIKNKVNEIKNNPNPTDEDKIFLQNYNYMIAELDKKRKETEEQTKNMMEELCIISQIKGMYMCMGEGSDFNLNKAREIESENGILTLRGHIDGVDFAIRQDTNNPEARLQTSQKLARSTDGNTFSIGGKDKDNFVDSNFILPSQDEILDSIKETVTLKSSLEKFDNPADYLENLQSNIMGDIDEKYKDTEYVHHYMQGQVGGEKIIDNTLGLINNAKQNITDDETLMKGINQTTNKDLFDFMKILKFNIDNSTNAEKDNLNKCITKIIEITDNYKNTNGVEDFVSLKYPPVIENYLKDKAWLNGGNEDSRLKMLSDLFKFYSEKSRDTRSNSEGNNGGTPSKMIINDLYRDLFEFQGGGKSEVASSRDMEKKLQSNNTIAWQESENADLILENWPEG